MITKKQAPGLTLLERMTPEEVYCWKNTDLPFLKLPIDIVDDIRADHSLAKSARLIFAYIDYLRTLDPPTDLPTDDRSKRQFARLMRYADDCIIGYFNKVKAPPIPEEAKAKPTTKVTATEKKSEDTAPQYPGTNKDYQPTTPPVLANTQRPQSDGNIYQGMNISESGKYVAPGYENANLP